RNIDGLFSDTTHIFLYININTIISHLIQKRNSEPVTQLAIYMYDLRAGITHAYFDAYDM
ncbi:hypothetical protein IJG90_03175, partial [Candidatus Saccharibacteria bacterium]|nr:hypothetical protein [Candidatus Saccharibacteria bacterium]